jgi:ABC-type lipopolysaccharide export system ATPase subunit
MNNNSNIQERDGDRAYIMQKGRVFKSGSYQEVVGKQLTRSVIIRP